jgi:hypothetical protein
MPKSTKPRSKSTKASASVAQPETMSAGQKASGLVALRIANNALMEALTSSGSHVRPKEASEAIHAAIELLETARRAFEAVKVS